MVAENKAWQMYLSTVPTAQRALAERFPPWTKWQLGQDRLTYYTPVAVRGDGRLVMARHVAVTHQKVQLHDGVDPKSLLPWPEGQPC